MARRSGSRNCLTFFEASNPVKGTESPSSLSFLSGIKASHNDGQTHTWIALKTSFFRCGRKAAPRKNTAKLRQAESNAMRETPAHPGGSITPGNLLGKPRLLIGFCLQPNVANDERRKGRSECIRDLRDYDRAVGQRQADGQGECRA